MAEGARAGACHLRVPPCGATQRCGDGPTSSCRQRAPGRGVGLGCRSVSGITPGRAARDALLYLAVCPLSTPWLTGTRGGRGGNPARFPVSEFPPLRGSKRVIGRRGGGSGRQYARATPRAAGGNARWARWRPRPGHRRPSAPQPRSPACARRGPRSLSRFRCETLRCRWRRQPL